MIRTTQVTHLLRMVLTRGMMWKEVAMKVALTPLWSLMITRLGARTSCRTCWACMLLICRGSVDKRLAYLRLREVVMLAMLIRTA